MCSQLLSKQTALGRVRATLVHTAVLLAQYLASGAGNKGTEITGGTGQEILPSRSPSNGMFI